MAGSVGARFQRVVSFLAQLWCGFEVGYAVVVAVVVGFVDDGGYAVISV